MNLNSRESLYLAYESVDWPNICHAGMLSSVGHCTRSSRVTRKSLPALAGAIATSLLRAHIFWNLPPFQSRALSLTISCLLIQYAVLMLTHRADHDLLPSIRKCSSHIAQLRP